MCTFKYLLLVVTPIFVLSCVSSKKFKEVNKNYSKLDSAYRNLEKDYANCKDSTLKYKGINMRMDARLKEQKDYNDQMLNQLKDLSVISSSQAESIKKSLDNISAKDSYIKNLQSAIARKDSLTMNLVMNLISAIGNLYDEDINIKVEKGVVYIDISDKLLFVSGRYEVTEDAKLVLGKVARVLLNQPEIEFMVEGHTDNVPYRRGYF